MVGRARWSLVASRWSFFVVEEEVVEVGVVVAAALSSGKCGQGIVSNRTVGMFQGEAETSAQPVSGMPISRA